MLCLKFIPYVKAQVHSISLYWPGYKFLPCLVPDVFKLKLSNFSCML